MASFSAETGTPLWRSPVAGRVLAVAGDRPGRPAAQPRVRQGPGRYRAALPLSIAMMRGVMSLLSCLPGAT